MAVFRKLLPDEGTLYRNHLLRLQPEDRHARFCGTVSDESIHRYCARIDWTRSRLIGAFLHGELRGCAELRFDPGWPGRGEIAVSVERGFQDSGIGAELTRRMLTVARNRGIRTVTLHCLPGNRRMQAITRRCRGEVVIRRDEATGTVTLWWPDQISLLREACDDGGVWLSALLERLGAGKGRRAPAPAA